eukprot:scaffold11702_cov56-Cylindrotheca_fusiformis.AAC.3
MTLKEIERFAFDRRREHSAVLQTPTLGDTRSRSMKTLHELEKTLVVCGYSRGDFIPSTFEVIDYAPFHK